MKTSFESSSNLQISVVKAEKIAHNFERIGLFAFSAFSALRIVSDKLDIFFLRKRLAEIIALYIVAAHFF